MFYNLPIDLQDYIHQIIWKCVFNKVLKQINEIHYEEFKTFSLRKYNSIVQQCHYQYPDFIYSDIPVIKYSDQYVWVSFTSWSRLKPHENVFDVKDIFSQHLMWG